MRPRRSSATGGIRKTRRGTGAASYVGMTGRSTTRRLGFALTLAEGGAFAAGAVARSGALGGTPIVAATIVETFVALALALAVAAPGATEVRVERVLSAHILAVVGLLIARVAIASTGPAAADELAYLTKLALALAAIALVIWPPGRQRIPRAARRQARLAGMSWRRCQAWISS